VPGRAAGACPKSRLHGVALRVCADLRKRRGRSRAGAELPANVPGGDTFDDITWREIQVLLDEELLGTVKVEAGRTAQVKFEPIALPKLLKGVVMGADGKPVSGVEVTLLAPADEGVILTKPREFDVRSRSWDLTRADGRFTLAFLPGLEKSRFVLAWHKRHGWTKISVKDLESGTPVRLAPWNVL
jgi:hypothetical protein